MHYRAKHREKIENTWNTGCRKKINSCKFTMTHIRKYFLVKLFDKGNLLIMRFQKAYISWLMHFENAFAIYANYYKYAATTIV